MIARIYPLLFAAFVILTFSMTASAQDAPKKISLLAFTMETDAIRAILKGGISQDEWNQLQEATAAQNGLTDGPLTLQPGENAIRIGADKKKSLAGQSGAMSLVLIYTVQAPDSGVSSGGSIQRTHYGLNATDGKVLERNATWNYPAGTAKYRYLDFRSTGLLGVNQFVYELRTEFGGDATDYKVVISE